MFESFVIMLREGVEVALVIGILLVVLKQTGRRDLERIVFWGLGLAVAASVVAAVALDLLVVDEEAYEGVLYWTSAAFVISMIAWMHRRSRTLRATIERQVERAADAGKSAKEAWGLGAFAFLMVFREGAEAVMFLSAVRLTTDALLSFIGALLGLAAAIAFGVLFVRGSLQIDLRRFFAVTGWVLAIFVAQLIVNGYHEFSEAGVVPATQQSMALVGAIVRNNTLFLLAMVAIPLFIWMTGRPETLPEGGDSAAEQRLAAARIRRTRFYRYGATGSALLVLVAIGVLYAREAMPATVPPPEPVTRAGSIVALPLEKLRDGRLHRLGFLTGGRLVRFLAMQTADGRVRTALDACEICGALGYIQEGDNLVCLNCAAGINPMTLNRGGGCNPIPLVSAVVDGQVRIAVAALEEAAPLFVDQPGLEEIDPVCGMRVKMSQATAFETYEGKIYYFCNRMDNCREAFRQNPSAYVE